MAALRLPFGALPALALLAGCTAAGPFPSLLPRPGEADVSVEEPVRTPVPVAPDPELRSRVAALLGDARRGEEAFAAAAALAEAAAGGAGGEGSEGWISAQQALSAAEAARAPTVNALAELDALALARAGQPTNQQEFEALLAALAEVQRIGEAQHARLERLRARLSR